MNYFFYSPRFSGWKTRWLSEMTPSSGRSVSRVSAPWRSESLATLTEVCTPAEPRMITERQLSAASWRSNVSQDLKAVLKSEVFWICVKTLFQMQHLLCQYPVSWISCVFVLYRGSDCRCRQEISWHCDAHRWEIWFIFFNTLTLYLLSEYQYTKYTTLSQHFWQNGNILGLALIVVLL